MGRRRSSTRSSDSTERAVVVAALLAYGRQPSSGSSYTNNRPAEAFVRRNDNAFLLGVIFDQGIPYEKAWEAPYLLKRRLGHFSMRRLAGSPIPEIRRALRGATEGEALQRFTTKVAWWLRAAARKLIKDYRGDAGNIWQDCWTAGEVIERLDDFPGIGQKKAHMAARILHEERAPHEFVRWQDINVAVDIHVRRVFKRTGLVESAVTSEILAEAARLHPRYPGALDVPAWSIGQGWCGPKRADCGGRQRSDGQPCPLRRVCPKKFLGRLAYGY